MTRLLYTLLVIFAAVGVARAQDDPLAAVPRITQDEFKTLRAANKVLVVDVRDQDSYWAGHIPGAINIWLGDMERREPIERLKAEKRLIVVYCA
jgi:rhodanese-related sulfurtransferase